MKKAVAVFQRKITGYVLFIDHETNISVNVHLEGKISDGKHGFHIHSKGNLMNDNCSKCGGHYNPENVSHGGRRNGHAGDLGNLIFKNNKCHTRFEIPKKFSIPEIYGRSLVIHAGEDDLGKGDNKESLMTGNSGARFASAVVGRY